MIIKAIVIPTPKRIKKKIKANIDKEDIFLYGLIAGGLGVIGMSDIEFKALPIFGLVYCGFSYSVLKNMDDETLAIILRDYDGFRRMY